MAAVATPQLKFEAPTVIGTRILIKGPSGWLETFQRAKLDAELTDFFAPAPFDQVVNLFIQQRAVADLERGQRVPIDWFSIVGFIGRITGCSPLHVPHTVGIAFWANIVLTMSAQDAN